jgi:hypothetical protein
VPSNGINRVQGKQNLNENIKKVDYIKYKTPFFQIFKCSFQSSENDNRRKYIL